MPRFGSIEHKHGVDEPGYVPPQDRGERLAETGEKFQAAGKQMQSCGGSLVALGCSGFVLLIIVFIVIGVLSGSSNSGSSTTPPASSESAKTNCEHPSAAEPCAGRALEEWHREHGETPLRVQEGREAPSEEEQKNQEAKVKEAEAEKEAIREGLRLKSEGKVTPEEEGSE
jgi:hypothetical protein